MDTAKVFWSGRSQAVRLPKEYRIQSGEVRIRRRGNAIILEPIAENWDWLKNLGPIDDDFAEYALEQQPGQERPGLGGLFD